MSESISRLLMILAMLGSSVHSFAATQPNILDEAVQVAPLLEAITNGRAFSFVYDGQSSAQVLPRWKQIKSVKSLSEGRELHVTTYSDPTTGLEVTSEITVFSDAPAIECILRLHNAGKQDTPIIEKILPLDFPFVAKGTGKIVLHSVQGSMGKTEDYLPIDQDIATGSKFHLAHYVLAGSEHVNGQLPFFNVQWQKGGLIGAVGWTGQWAVQVSGENGRKILLQVGQETTHLKLHAGETIRTPRVLLLQWTGEDRLAGHNAFRRLLLAHYVPRIDGKIVVPPVSNSNAFVYMYDAIEKKTKQNPLDVVAHVMLHMQRE